ncbi:uroporphyrinogen-III synthase [Methanocaldococcus indicus]|uniref:uroporphyrinogen-III synthase n=1 Tax=Methanocaldococcus indicus TaxID=213231 RepID=UPI003C6CD635
MDVIITRPKERAKAFLEILKKEGFNPIILPTIEIVYKKVNINLDKYNWIIFTSPSGVIGLYKNLKDKNLDNKKIAVIGEKTNKTLKKYFNREADIIPSEYTAEKLLEEIKKVAKRDDKFLFPTTPATRDILKNNLNVDLVYVYSSEEPKDLKEKINNLKNHLKDKKFILTFTSSLTAKNFFKYVDDEFYNTIKNNYVVAIGPITAKTLEELNLSPITPKKYTIEGMLKEIKKLRE